MSKPPKATWEDLLKLGEDFKGEIIDGEIVEKEGGTSRHGLAQLVLGAATRRAVRRTRDPRR